MVSIIGNDDALASVGKFCYLGDRLKLLNAEGGADLAVVARVRCARKKFSELFPIFPFGLSKERCS